MAAFHGAALVSLITFLPIYLRAVRGASPAETGAAVAADRRDRHRLAGTGQLVTRTGRTAIFPTVGLTAATMDCSSIALFDRRI